MRRGRRALDQIKLTWQMDYGTVGCDTDERTPVARAIRQLFADGKPFSNLCMCFFRETSGTLRWLGVFVQSAAGRIIYFPGIRNGFDHIQGHQGATLQWRQAFDFDHMSLEQDRLKWHVTATRSTAHLGSPRTLPLGQDRFLWMGLSIADAQVMRPVMKETSIVFDTPPNDSRRRIEVLHQARDGAQFPMVSLNGNHPIRFDEWFLHFSFIVGPKGSRTMPAVSWAYPGAVLTCAVLCPRDLPVCPRARTD